MLLWTIWLATASAWELSFVPFVWETSPIEIVFDDREPEGVESGDLVRTAEAAWSVWEDTSCIDELDIQSGPIVNDLTLTFDPIDPRNHIAVDDPSSTIEVGVIAATLVHAFGIAFEIDGVSFLHAAHGDIGLNDGVEFRPPEAVDADQCGDAYDLQSVLAHEFGHFLGFGHSTVADATLYETQTPCDPGPRTLHADDVAAMHHLYGTMAHSASCTPRVGTAPLQVTCELQTLRDPATTAYSWRLPDGTLTAGRTLELTLEDTGSHVVEACTASSEPECAGLGTCTEIELSVCGATTPEIRVDSTPEPLLVKLLNDTRLDALGCVTQVNWQVEWLDEERLVYSGESWEPVVPLPSEGSYAATLTLTDFAGEAHSLTSEFHTRDLVQEVHTAPRGCVMTSGGPHHPWWILIGMATVAIRRGYGGRSR